MRNHASGGATTIIKRANRKKHHVRHSGAWKVAFADFTLAMMALFMVLWIVGVVSEEERQEIVAQLNGKPFLLNNLLFRSRQKVKAAVANYRIALMAKSRLKRPKATSQLRFLNQNNH